MNTLAVPPTQEQPSWPYFEADELEAAQRVLKSGKINYWTGEEGRHFESEFARYIGTNRAVALANGSVAIELALRALGIGPGDEVIVTPRSFMASASSVALLGATPIFADVDLTSGNLSADSVAQVASTKTKALIPVHLGGWPCEMDSLLQLGIPVIEDCAQAHGAEYKGRKVGSFGMINTWSFCQDKIITTAGEGGMITTSDETLAEFCWSFKDHGKSRPAVERQDHEPGYRWLHESFGTNWRLTEVQSAMGRVALRKLDGWVQQRTINARAFADELSGLPALTIPSPPAYSKHAYYRLYGQVNQEALKPDWSRDRIMATIADSGVPCFVGSCSELYREKAFVSSGFAPHRPLPIAAQLAKSSLCWLVHPTLSETDMRRMAGIVRSVVLEATR